MSSPSRILVACEFSGVIREAFKEKGWDAWSCDLLDTEIEGQHIKGDVLDILDEGWDLMIAHPPCDHLAASGARWFPEKRADGRQQAAIDFFLKLAEADIPKIAIENPVGIMSSSWRKPDQYIQPWEHGHGETKKTGLWLKNLPLLKPSDVVEGREPKVYKTPDVKDRWKIRSRTYTGIAKAMAEQWTKTNAK